MSRDHCKLPLSYANSRHYIFHSKGIPYYLLGYTCANPRRPSILLATYPYPMDLDYNL